MKNILVFGGGELQYSLIEKIKSRNYRVILIDPNIKAFSKQLADYFEKVEGDDFEETCKIVEKYNIDSIITAATDKPLRMMAKIASKYNFKFFSEQTARQTTDKFLMKKVFKENKIPFATGALIYRDNNWNIFPCIIKPRDNSGSRGVIFCKDNIEFNQALNITFEFTKLDSILAEEYISGKEYSVESLHYNDINKVIQITEKRTTAFPYNVELGHLQPSDLESQFLDKIDILINKIAFALNFENCASHTELKINNDSICVIETSPRLGGDFITSSLVTLSTGIDMEDCLLDISLGNMPKTDQRIKNASAIEYLHFSPGIFKNLNNVLNNTYLKEFKCTLEKGSIIPEITNSTDRYGHFIVSAPTKAELLSEMENIRQIINDAIEIY